MDFDIRIMRHFAARLYWALLCFAWTQTASSQGVDPTWDYAVQITATVQASPPRITLNWVQDSEMTPTNYMLFRKLPSDTSWGSGVTLGGSTTSFTDNNVQAGQAYEYRLLKNQQGFKGYGYIQTGIAAPLKEYRGKVIFLVESSLTNALQAELARYQQDLVGDGWEVIRRHVSKSAPVTEVKALIRGEYWADPANVRALFLLGHVPVPYSGDIFPDGHNPEHRGAWPADAFYGDMDGAWTDNTVYSVGSANPKNRNVPGDGKFDQSLLPSDLELEVGRVDFAEMPGLRDYNGPATFPSEVELTRQYLNKNFNYRHKVFSVPARALVSDNFGIDGGYAYAASGYRSFAPLVGPNQIYTLVQPGYWISELANQPYLLTYGCGPGNYTTMSGLGWHGDYHELYATDLVDSDIRAVFTMIYGSYFGDWDNQDNLLRATLAAPTYTLAAIWAGTPHWFLHPMGLGETLGYCTRLTQNNRSVYQQVNPGTRQVHVSLLGDPTLRLHVVAPPRNFQAVQGQGNSVVLTWNGSQDAVAGYHVFRGASANGPFQRVNSALLTGTSFTNLNLSTGVYHYMVRAVKWEQGPSGSYTNASQGLFASATVTDTSPDSDGDGITDVQEQAAGTDPYNSSSVLKVLGLERSPAGGLKITWSSVAGKTYQVVFRSGFSSGTWNPVSGSILATSAKTEWTDTAREMQGCYRVVCKP